MDKSTQQKEKSQTIETGEKQDAPRMELPQFSKSNISATAKQMFPGCEVAWSAGVGKKHKLSIIMQGKERVKDLMPISIQGSLTEIAKTLVTMFACIQHVVMERIHAGIQREQRIKQMDDAVRIHTPSPVTPEDNDVAPIVLPPDEGSSNDSSM